MYDLTLYWMSGDWTVELIVDCTEYCQDAVKKSAMLDVSFSILVSSEE